MIHVAFEGIDGSGKSTQLRAQYEHLKERYGENNIGICRLNSLDHPTGRLVKRLYGFPRNRLTDILRNRVVQETLYAFCARASLRKTPEIDRDIVLSDRSLLTPFAHHRGKIPDWYLTLVEPEFYPDIVMYIDIPPELASERIVARDGIDAKETIDKLKTFHEGYESVIANRPRVLQRTKIIRIDGIQPLDRVTDDVREKLTRELNQNK